MMKNKKDDTPAPASFFLQKKCTYCRCFTATSLFTQLFIMSHCKQMRTTLSIVFLFQFFNSTFFAAAPPVNLFFERLPTEIISEILYYTFDDDQDALASTLFLFDHNGKEISYALYQKTQYTRFITENFLKKEFFTQMFPYEEKTKNGFSFTNILLNRWFVTCDIVRNNQTQIKNPLQFFFHFYTKAQIAQQANFLVHNIANHKKHIPSSLHSYLLLWMQLFKDNFLCKNKFCVFIHDTPSNVTAQEQLLTTFVHHTVTPRATYTVSAVDLVTAWARKNNYNPAAVKIITTYNAYMTKQCVKAVKNYHIKQIAYILPKCSTLLEKYTEVRSYSYTQSPSGTIIVNSFYLNELFFLTAYPPSRWSRFLTISLYSIDRNICQIKNIKIQNTVNLLGLAFFGVLIALSSFEIEKKKVLTKMHTHFHDLEKIEKKMNTLHSCKRMSENFTSLPLRSLFLRWNAFCESSYYNTNDERFVSCPSLPLPLPATECNKKYTAALSASVNRNAIRDAFKASFILSCMHLFHSVMWHILLRWSGNKNIQNVLFYKHLLLDVPILCYLVHTAGSTFFMLLKEQYVFLTTFVDYLDNC